MQRALRPPRGGTLLLLLVAGIGSFLLATAYAEYTAAQNHVYVAGLSHNAFPSVTRLTAVRSALLQELTLSERLDDPGVDVPDVLARIDASRRVAGRELAAYQALPTFPDEVPLAQQLSQGMQTLDEALERERSLASADLAGAVRVHRTEVRPAADQASSLAGALIDLNAARGQGLAAMIDHTRRQATRIAFGLDSLCALLTTLAAVSAYRTIRFYLDQVGAQQRLLQDRATELEAFSSRVAHDVLNPLTGVKAALELVGRNGSAERRAAALDRARAALLRATRIVDGLLVFARAGARPEPGAVADLRAVAADVLRGFAEAASAAGIALRAEGPIEGAVACHPGVLTSVLTNLVGNALKYMGSSELRVVTLRARTSLELVHVEVEDTGPGVPPGKERTLFEPYARGGVPGVPGIGLGLATVKRLSLAHGGRVGLRPAPGHGSVFWFELPTARPAQPQGERHPGPGAWAPDPGRA